MKIVVTGGTGFIGRHLITELRRRGDFVISLQRHGGTNTDADQILIDDGNVDSLSNLLSDHGPDGIIHLASHFVAEHKTVDIAKISSSNLDFPLRVLDAAATSRCSWFLNTGTFWQHYENASYDPVNLYAASKQAFQGHLPCSFRL